jgi:hypothetical protein
LARQPLLRPRLARAGDSFSVPRDQLPEPTIAFSSAVVTGSREENASTENWGLGFQGSGSRKRFEAIMMIQKQRVAFDLLSRVLLLSAMIFIGVIVLYWR